MDAEAGKMSKSKPETGVFLHDDPDTVEEKLDDAYCPQGEVDGNPVLDMLRLVVWPSLDGTFVVERPDEYGGDLRFDTFEEVTAAFAEGELHPLDLKGAVADALNEVLEDVRAYFDEHPRGLKALETALADPPT